MAVEKGRLPGDLHVGGRLSADAMDIPDDAIGDTQVDIANPITPQKIIQQYMKDIRYAGTVAPFEQPLHVAYAPGTLMSFEAGCITPPTGSAEITIDFLKNGVTVLSAQLRLSVAASTAAARVTYPAGVNPAAADYVEDDWFDVKVTTSAPSGAIGSDLFITAIFNEQPA